MSISEITSTISETSKSENKGGFDVDRRWRNSGEVFAEDKTKKYKSDFDIDKRCVRLHETLNREIEKEKIEFSDPVCEKIEKSIATADGLEELIEKHPEKNELWKDMWDALDTLNDPESSSIEIKSAQGMISQRKGLIMEIAAKDALAEAGFDVESTQRTIKGENGDTKPDVIAHNNTEKQIKAFGINTQLGESLFAECKCGSSIYLDGQLNNHIPNQLSGHEGISVLLTTADIKDTIPGLAKQVCAKYNTKLIIADKSVRQVDNTIKEVFGK